jgi:NAD(P)-dependent dehydrogenase (short-subunit alcohol dehydrogenase family)
MREFAGRVAVVTGAASGIGRAMATRFAQEGMRVVLADVEEAALDRAVEELRSSGATVEMVVCDVSRHEDVEQLAHRTLEAFGAVHVVCNNAGVGGGFGRIWEASLADWRWVLDVNLWGVIHGVRTFVPIMLERGDEGHIVNTASVAGLVPGTRVYSVSKHAVVALSEALYHGLAQVGARVHASVLCPGLINTRIMYGYRNRPPELFDTPGVAASPAEVARAERIAQQAQSTGLPPEKLADLVLQAIRSEQLYILTDPERDADISARMESILARRNPAIYRSPLGD